MDNEFKWFIGVYGIHPTSGTFMIPIPDAVMEELREKVEKYVKEIKI